jgi:hypothetical protein
MAQTGKLFLVEGGCCEFVKFVKFVRRLANSDEDVKPQRHRGTEFLELEEQQAVSGPGSLGGIHRNLVLSSVM